MTNTPQTYTEPVTRLMTLGDPRGALGWRNYLALGFTEQHVPELCRLALDEELAWADSDSAEVWSGLHAWRTLAQLKAANAIPALLELLSRIDEDINDWVSDEIPLVLAHIGQAALEPLRAFLADARYGTWSRAAVGRSFAEIGQHHPELRADCVAALSRQLEQFAQQEENLNAFLIGYLVDLKGVEAAPVIEQAFAAGKVDLMVQGDWEQVQIYLGLLAERQTPSPDYRAIMAEQMGFDPGELLDNFKAAAQAKLQQKAERQAERQAATRDKAKRKQAKKSRKKQRKRK